MHFQYRNRVFPGTKVVLEFIIYKESTSNVVLDGFYAQLCEVEFGE